ncbi:MAG TPA: toll/interleukin-1 receptor domain-containing protein [Candidatus Kapabacteria bacterium]|jgi:hypothetical protein|nr:toll/interleukin-1 receptor domain-containing protein [Candidatus Kapabacteria bacterium]
MEEETTQFELVSKLEHYLAVLAALYEREGNREVQALLVNAKHRIDAGWEFDNWNGGTHGHALFLELPKDLYLSVVQEKDRLERELRDRLSLLHNVANEYFARVFLEMLPTADDDWRRRSGLLLAGTRKLATSSLSRIWGDCGYRIFLSHKSEVKRETAAVKQQLARFGCGAFVAHEDVEPTREWVVEIENALASMDCFVALLTEGYHESNWTDQEVGYAVARGVPVISIRLGRDPYGFIGRFQALSATWETAVASVMRLLIEDSRVFEAYSEALSRCASYERANELAIVLPHLRELSSVQLDRLVTIYNSNEELRGAFGFNGKYPSKYGGGLVTALNRLSKGTQYALVDGCLVRSALAES